VAREARGHGIATEALRQLTDWAFGRGLQRLELRIDTDNAASQYSRLRE
jgi:RimJ/RimL family protein N-acetyltransferase